MDDSRLPRVFVVFQQSKADKDRKILLVGDAVSCGGLSAGSEADFRQMMDEALSRPVDWALFDLD